MRIKLIEDLVILAAAAMLAAWSFSSRSAAWNAALVLAALVLAAILIRRLAGWIRAGRTRDEDAP